MLALADKSCFDSKVFAVLNAGCRSDYDNLVAEGVHVDEVIIEPKLFNDIEPFTTRTYPNPHATHLMISDNLDLLIEKIRNFVPWGLV